MAPEAHVRETEHGLVATGEGWFVVNTREARWFDRDGQRLAASFRGETDFPQVGVSFCVLRAGEPMAMYHWETDQEDFLVLAGEPRLIIEGEERRLRRWDLVHCPAGTKHVIVGAGETPCVVVGIGARWNHTTIGPDGLRQGRSDWGAYSVDDAAIRHGAGVEEETTDAEVAYARFPKPEPMRYPKGLLP
jgi:mannose-6-phosphate isomerase-like protein (cupin superfamily)